MNESILSFIVGFINGILFLIVMWNLIDPYTWTPENTPRTARAHLNFREVNNAVRATIFCPTGKMFPRSGPGYVVQFAGVDPESSPIEPVYERHWGWVQMVSSERADANSD